MQTIKLETEAGDGQWARGRNAFKPVKIEIMDISCGKIRLDVLSIKSEGKRAYKMPITICMKRKEWIKVLVALGEELGK